MNHVSILIYFLQMRPANKPSEVKINLYITIIILKN